MALRLTGRACWRVGQKQALTRPTNTGHPSLRHRLGHRYMSTVKGIPRAGLGARSESLWSRSFASSSPSDPPTSLSPAMKFLSDRGYHGEIAKVGLSLCLPACLPACISARLLVCRPVCLSVCLVWPSACPEPACLIVCLSIYLSQL
jgi:hypothetical protein